MGVDLFGLIFAGFSCIFLFAGAMMARRQARRIATYRSVPATVISSEVGQDNSGDGGPTYFPKIRFSYTAAGQSLESTDALPGGKLTSSSSWSRKIVDRYPAGLRTEAFVDPDDPKKVFLVPEVSVFPYVFIMFPMIHFTVGLGLMLAGGDPPRFTLAQATLICAIAWNVVGVACLFHYRGAGGRMGLGTQIAFLLYGGVGLIMLVVATNLSNAPAEAPKKPSASVKSPATKPVKKPATRPLPPVELPSVEKP
jgi:hypothetical protein